MRLAYALASLSNTIGGGKRSGPDAAPESYQPGDFPWLVPQSAPRGSAADVDPEQATRQIDAFFSSQGWDWEEEE